MNNVCHLIDNMEFMKTIPDKFYDLAIVDPEQGRKEHGGINRSGEVKQKNGKQIYVAGNKYIKKNWDNKPAGLEYFNELFRVSKNQIIWGENYFILFFTSGRIVWDKCNDGSDQSNCEIAYNSMTDKVEIFRFMWRGMFQGRSISSGTIQQGDKSKNEQRIHPTQKPIALYKWLLQNYAKPGWTIFDSHVGSGSIRIACHDMGFDFTGCENDPDYWQAQEERFKNHIGQSELFDKQEIQQEIYVQNDMEVLDV
jgi:site-specific DNA-methyltransferase (adenine-specific)